MNDDWVDDQMNSTEEEERAIWFAAAAIALERAYEEDEPEYPLELIEETNPEFRRS